MWQVKLLHVPVSIAITCTFEMHLPANLSLVFFKGWFQNICWRNPELFHNHSKFLFYVSVTN